MTAKTSEFLTLKEMILGSGCTARTVRYYEHQGLIRAIRSPGGHRLFPPEELERLNFISHLRKAGCSLEQISTLFNLRHAHHEDRVACRKLNHMVSQQIEQLDQKVTALKQLQSDLQASLQLLATCCECSQQNNPPDCQSCQQVPETSKQPDGFRFAWHAQANPSPFVHSSLQGQTTSPPSSLEFKHNDH